MGPPGAGKGTQAIRVENRLKVPRISSGDLFRDHQSKGTKLGVLAQSYMKQGLLVPDNVTINMVMEWISKQTYAKGFILDGFPRTFVQAKSLDRELEGRGEIDIAVYITVPEDEIVRRLSGRLVCSACQAPHQTASTLRDKTGTCDRCRGELYQRDDDKPEAVKKRIKVYLNDTAPLVDYYKRSGKLKEVNGEGSVEDVWETLETAIHIPSE